MTFQVSPSKIIPITSISTGFARQSDTGNDTSGKATTNTKGMELQQVQIDTSYVAGMGVDPRAMIDSWRARFGRRYPLYIGGKKFGANFFELESVDVGNIVLNNAGKFLQVDLSITLTEYVPAGTTASKKNGTKSSASSKAGAKSARASSTDKSTKKTVKVR